MRIQSARTALAGCAAVALLAIPSAVYAVEHQVEPLDAPPPEGVAPAIAEQLDSGAFKVLRGAKRTTLLEFWPVKQWPVQADFSPSNTILYPLEMGQLIGVVRYARKGGDFRGQQIPSGVYTVRYALQPVDGNHVGTSDTRDFLLLLPAEQDSDSAPLDKSDLFKLSAQASGTTHPAMLSLLSAGDAAGSLPAIEHDEVRDLWSVRFANPTAAGETTDELVVKLVVVGKAAE